jgi:choline dehydrogenase-like flavoprotein
MPNMTYVTLSASPQHCCLVVQCTLTRAMRHTLPSSIPNSFSVPFDVKLAVAGLTFLRKIAATFSYTPLLSTEILPGKGADLQHYVLTSFGTEFHPVGTSSMLPKEHGGVVDSSLKVYGTSNVRVVDASIIPLHISAHTQATVYGIAEKAADMILLGQ